MEKSLYSQVSASLQKGKAVVLIRIINSSGSTPRRVGSACYVDEEGAITGSVGGGLLEHKVIAKAKELFHTKTSWTYNFELTQEESDQEGMICGGEVTCYLEPLFPNDEDLTGVLNTINCHLEDGQSVTLFTRVSHGSNPMDRKSRKLVTDQAHLHTVALGKHKSRVGKINSPELLACEDNNEYIFAEPIAPAPVVILCGAGHISACVAPLAKMVGFKVVVLDDRQEFANRERFPGVDKVCVGPFVQTLAETSITKSAYVVIVTRGHAYDKVVLETVLDRGPAYIGMIGSIRKRDALYEALIKKGASQKKLSTVYSPIGIDIGAQTPEEIAVSIVGELIKVRAGAAKKSERLY